MRALVLLMLLAMAGCTADGNDGSEPVAPSPTSAPEAASEASRLEVVMDPQVGGDHGTVAVARLLGGTDQTDVVREHVEATGIGVTASPLVTWEVSEGRYELAVHLGTCGVEGCPEELSGFAGPWRGRTDPDSSGRYDFLGPCRVQLQLQRGVTSQVRLIHASNPDNSCAVVVEGFAEPGVDVMPLGGACLQPGFNRGGDRLAPTDFVGQLVARNDPTLARVRVADDGRMVVDQVLFDPADSGLQAGVELELRAIDDYGLWTERVRSPGASFRALIVVPDGGGAPSLLASFAEDYTLAEPCWLATDFERSVRLLERSRRDALHELLRRAAAGEPLLPERPTG